MKIDTGECESQTNSTLQTLASSISQNTLAQYFSTGVLWNSRNIGCKLVLYIKEALCQKIQQVLDQLFK